MRTLRLCSSVLTRTFVYFNDGMVHREQVPRVRVRASVLTDFVFHFLNSGLEILDGISKYKISYCNYSFISKIFFKKYEAVTTYQACHSE